MEAANQRLNERMQRQTAYQDIRRIRRTASRGARRAARRGDAAGALNLLERAQQLTGSTSSTGMQHSDRMNVEAQIAQNESMARRLGGDAGVRDISNPGVDGDASRRQPVDLGVTPEMREQAATDPASMEPPDLEAVQRVDSGQSLVTEREPTNLERTRSLVDDISRRQASRPDPFSEEALIERESLKRTGHKYGLTEEEDKALREKKDLEDRLEALKKRRADMGDLSDNLT